ncbi:hypothetical protein CLG96_15305 [Sphingomonas oleivorans]|uniref:PilZ domain-containing protein n=1 Tax=Sphingomonas oleivorans TaxID=1735121 RepID=A0A2T5FV06_9SPHN|nr:PilZ domain-containing protein [Sphingomonas oleivorans]PTQ08560.1 hypothetical protein CLG96_15305 [Sphingomonas oleivorans]
MERFIIFGGDDAATAIGDARSEPRESIFLAATMQRPGGAAVPVTVRNISGGGLMAEGDGSFVPGEAIEVELRGVGPVSGRIAWTGAAGRLGVAFDRRIDPRLVSKSVMDGRQPVPTKPAAYMRRQGQR